MSTDNDKSENQSDNVKEPETASVAVSADADHVAPSESKRNDGTTGDVGLPSQSPEAKDLALHPYKRKRQLFAAAIALQLVLLFVTAVPSAFTLATGRVVTFDTTPVDPWDFFRGDYVTLGYEFSSVPSTETYKYDDRVYVILIKNAESKWVATRVQRSKPDVQNDNEIALRARVLNSYDSKAQVRYGIERVYIPERTGLNLKSGDNVQVDVAIGQDGLAVIKEVRAKGTQIFSWKLF